MLADFVTAPDLAGLDSNLGLRHQFLLGPVNIGSDEMISINNLAEMVIGISGKNISIKNIPGPLGVRGRNSDNRLIKEKLNWAPSVPLKVGIGKTFAWISQQVVKNTVK